MTIDGAILPVDRLPVAALDLTARDLAMLGGSDGPARRIAVEVICAVAVLQDATTLIDLTQGHIDGCILANDANRRFAEKMAGMGDKGCIPTTMNAISVDHGSWRTQGVPPISGYAQRDWRMRISPWAHSPALPARRTYWTPRQSRARRLVGRNRMQ